MHTLDALDDFGGDYDMVVIVIAGGDAVIKVCGKFFCQLVRGCQLLDCPQSLQLALYSSSTPLIGDVDILQEIQTKLNTCHCHAAHCTTGLVKQRTLFMVELKKTSTCDPVSMTLARLSIKSPLGQTYLFATSPCFLQSGRRASMNVNYSHQD